MKFRWVTDQIVSELRNKGFKVTVNSPGGDDDTDEVIVEVDGGEGIFISGFNPNQGMPTPSDAEVDCITIGDGQDSDGGLNSDNPATIQAYADVRKMFAALTEKTETGIYDHYEDCY